MGATLKEFVYLNNHAPEMMQAGQRSELVSRLWKVEAKLGRWEAHAPLAVYDTREVLDLVSAGKKVSRALIKLVNAPTNPNWASYSFQVIVYNDARQRVRLALGRRVSQQPRPD
jgi:hypothetical protein